MTKRKNDIVKISSDLLLDELLFPAVRYCIGRRSYVSAYAKDYWKVIQANRDRFNEERLQFFARDIKAEISSRMRWWDNVKTEEDYNSTIKYDAYFLLTKYLCKHPDCKFAETDFDINCLTGEVTASPRETPVQEDMNPLPDFNLSEWSKLASALADTVTVIYKGDDNTKMTQCFLVYDSLREKGNEAWRFEESYHLIDNWSMFIPDERIIQVIPNEPKDGGEESD